MSQKGTSSRFHESGKVQHAARRLGFRGTVPVNVSLALRAVTDAGLSVALRDEPGRDVCSDAVGALPRRPDAGPLASSPRSRASRA